MVEVDTRADWATLPNGAAPQDPADRRGTAVHWPGFRWDVDAHTGCLAWMQRIERDEKADGYGAIAYNMAACQHGRIVEGRGVHRRSGANGSTDSNLRYGSVVALIGPDQEPTDALLVALLRAADLIAPGQPLKTHNDVRPQPTACPGPALTAWIRAGAPPPAAPTPPEPEDFMATMTEQEKTTLLQGMQVLLVRTDFLGNTWAPRVGKVLAALGVGNDAAQAEIAELQQAVQAMRADVQRESDEMQAAFAKSQRR